MRVRIIKCRWEKALVAVYSGEAYFVIASVISHF